MTRHEAIPTEYLSLPYMQHARQLDAYTAGTGDAKEELVIMTLDFTQEFDQHDSRSMTATRQLMALAEVIVDMRGETPYPGHAYHFTRKTQRDEVRALETMIQQHRPVTPKLRRLGRRHNNPMRLGYETQATAMKLSTGKHLIAIQAEDLDNEVLAYGYVAPTSRRRDTLDVAELTLKDGLAGSAEYAAAAVMHHVASRTVDKPVDLTIPGDFATIDDRNVIFEAGFKGAQVVPYGLRLVARSSLQLEGYLEGAYDLAVAKSVKLPQKS